MLADERSALIDKQITEANQALAALSIPFKRISAVEEWEASFLRLQHRWKILCLCADSQSGKSSFAENRFSRPYILTVEDAKHLDLKDFDHKKNDGIVLDNVNSWAQLLSWRALLQSRNAKSKGGQSGTNMCAHPQYLFGAPVIATVDLDAPDKQLVDPESPSSSR